jgi:hypothetical protein
LLSRAQVTPAVQLSEIFNALDPKTRHAFQVWQQELAKAARGNDQNLNDVLGNLPAFAADANDVLRVLDVQHGAVVGLVRNGGTVFGALGRDQAALRQLITTGENVFSTTAANANSLAAVFRVFPEFLLQSRLTMARLKTFALDTDPLMKSLLPVAYNLTPTLSSVRQLSPDLRRFFVNLGPLIDVSKTGLPAVRDVLLGIRPMLNALGPFLGELNPIFTWLSLHQQLISDFIHNAGAGLSATTATVGGSGTGHYLRQFGPTGPETISFYPNRDANNRGNVYPLPLWLTKFANAGGHFAGDWGFPAWDCNNTGGEHPSTSNMQACWVQPPLPGAASTGKIPHITKATYSKH